MYRFAIFASVLQFCFISFISGYQIDDSCNRKGIETDVRNAMTSAFEMVDAALNRITPSEKDQDTLFLLGKLLAGPGKDPNALPLAKTIQVLSRIRDSYRREVPRPESVGVNDIVIFCDHQRYQLIDEKEKLYKDTTNDVEVYLDEQLCKPKGLLDMGTRVALAITYNAERDTGVTRNDEPILPDQPTQLQICPWFVDWVKERKIKLHKEAMKTTIGKTVINLSEKTPFGFAQIDAFSLLDKVLLHEMTHGRAAFTRRDNKNKRIQEGLVDVDALKGFFSLPGIRWASYGWKLCTALAQCGEPLGEHRAADNNADTIALLGSVCKLMDDPENPRKVDDKGRIVPLRSSKVTGNNGRARLARSARLF